MSAQSTQNVQLQVDAACSSDYTLFGCIHDINGPDISVTSTDGTCLTSASGWKEFVAGFKDGGEVTFTLNVQTGDNFNDTLDVLGFCECWRIVVPNHDCASDTILYWTILFKGFLTKVGNKFEFDGIQVQDHTIKVTGPVTATAPA